PARSPSSRERAASRAPSAARRPTLPPRWRSCCSAAPTSMRPSRAPASAWPRPSACHRRRSRAALSLLAPTPPPSPCPATALDATRPTSANVSEVREQVLDASTRLGRLIEKLLDLSVLQAGGAEPRLVWYSIDEVLAEAVEQLSASDTAFKLSVEDGMPL